MKIAEIEVYQVDLPLKEGRYAWADGKYVDTFDSTVVRIRTDEGTEGFGEVCPLGPFYLPAFGPGARAGIAELAPRLIGEDPAQLARINALMDAALLGHPYVKSALDMACWDIAGKAAGQPVCHLLGGRFGESVALYRAISQRPPEEMAENVAQYRAEGYRKFQLKVGPLEMLSVLTNAGSRYAGFVARQPSVGLFIDLEVRMLGSPVLVGHTYRIDREVVALGESRRTESYWTLTTLTDEANGAPTAQVLLHQGVFKDSYPDYPLERAS